MANEDLEGLELIDKISDVFESSWKADSFRLITACLRKCPANLRASLFHELLQVDRELRRQHGVPVPVSQYREAFPEFEEEFNATERSSGPGETVVVGEASSVDGKTESREALLATGFHPRKFGRFHIRDELGRGSFGLVYRAYDPTLDREVALKLPTFSANNQPLVDRFLSEAQIAAQLQHPNIIAVWERGCIDKQYYLSTAFVEGMTLEEYLQESTVTVAAAVYFVRDLAEALDYAHQKSVVHRDIKPANVMIDAAVQPMIMDFGLAKRTDHAANLTTDDVIMGTPAYMSPEQARGIAADIGPQTDQYSLGVTFYQLLTGELPWSGSKMQVVSHLQGNPPPPSMTGKNQKIPVDLQAICQKMLQPDPASRYARCHAVADDLNRYLENRPVSVRKISTFESLVRWSRRNKLVSGLTAGIASTLVLSLIFVSVAWLNTQAAWSKAHANFLFAQSQQRKAESEEAKAKAERTVAVQQTEKARKAAIAQRKEAARVNLMLAGQRIQQGRFYEAEKLLESVDKADRNWIWRIHHNRIPEVLCKIDVGQSLVVSPQVFFDDTGSRIAVCVGQSPTTTTNIFDVQTGKLIQKVAPEYTHVEPMGTGFTRGGRYLIVSVRNDYRQSTTTVAAYDTQEKKIIKTHDGVRTFSPLDDCEDEVILLKPSGNAYDYTLWNFRENKVTKLGTGPWRHVFSYSVNAERTELIQRDHRGISITSIKTGEPVSNWVARRLEATDYNMSPDRQLVAGRLLDDWPWNARGRHIDSGNVGVVNVQGRMVSALEPEGHHEIHRQEKKRGYTISSNSKYVFLENQFEQGSKLVRPMSWWRCDTGEFLGQANGIRISPDGELYATHEEDLIVVRKAPLHMRGFASPQVQKALARLQPVTPAWQTLPMVFYDQEEPWVFLSHQNGRNVVEPGNRFISVKPSHESYIFRPGRPVTQRGTHRMAMINGDKEVSIFSLKTGKLLSRLPCQGAPNNWTLAFHPDGKHFVAGDGKGLVVWSLESGKVVERLPTVRTSPRMYRNKLSFSGDGELLALIASGKGLTVVDTTDWTVRWNKWVGRMAYKASISHDGKLVTPCGYGDIRVFDTRDGTLIKRIKTDDRSITPAFHPRLPYLLVGRHDGRLVIYDTRNWKIVFDEDICGSTIEDICFSESGESVAIANQRGTNRRWFELRASKQ